MVTLKFVDLDEVGSTQAVAKGLAATGAPEGTTVVARSQSSGEGRLGRAWDSPVGGLYMSFILRQGASQIPSVISTQNLMVAPMPGKVIRALVKKGERVKAGGPLIILESMKMEIAVRVDRDAEVSEILVEEGASVKRGQGLVRLSA